MFAPYCQRFGLSQLTRVRQKPASRSVASYDRAATPCGMTFEVLRLIHADHPSLPGHFPGAPLVPGVVILDEVVAALAEWRQNSQLSGIRMRKVSRATEAGAAIHDFAFRDEMKTLPRSIFAVARKNA